MFNNIKRKLLISFLTLFVLSLVYLFPTNKQYEETLKFKEAKYHSIYLLNKNILVETKIVSNNKTDILEQIKDIISSLTINSPKSKYIDETYSPLIPENTKVLNMTLENNLLKINFSKEFLNVNKNTEEKVIESLIYSLTKLDEVKEIMIFIENEKLDCLPISKKKLPLTLTKSFGINKVYNVNNVFTMDVLNLYYYTNINDEYHLVPVSIFTNDNKDKVEIIIEELKTSPIHQSNLMSFLSSNTKLLDYEIKENTIRLEFSSYLLDSFFNDSLIEEVKYAISKSFEDTLGITNVSLVVNGKSI